MLPPRNDVPHAVAFFGGVPQSVHYGNDRCLVSRILADGTRKRAQLISGFLSHDLVRDRYGRPGKGIYKGAVEGLVGWARSTAAGASVRHPARTP